MALGPGWLLLAREAKLCVIYGDTQILYTLPTPPVSIETGEVYRVPQIPDIKKTERRC